jgi:hypothetical protein
MKLRLTEEQLQLIQTKFPERLDEQFSRASRRLDLNNWDYASLRRRWENNKKYLRDPSQEAVKIGGNTWIVEVDDFTMAIRFHRTNIVEVDATNTITLDSGGWSDSMITRDRFGAILRCKGISMSSTNNVVYLHVRGYGSTEYESHTYVFEDGIEILANGDVILP